MVWADYRSQLCKCNDFNENGLFGRDRRHRRQLEVAHRSSRWRRERVEREQHNSKHPGVYHGNISGMHARNQKDLTVSILDCYDKAPRQ
jgi:hypothetical protein